MEREVPTTRYPRVRSACASPAPMPCDAPVTMATFCCLLMIQDPSKRRRGESGDRLCGRGGTRVDVEARRAGGRHHRGDTDASNSDRRRPGPNATQVPCPTPTEARASAPGPGHPLKVGL